LASARTIGETEVNLANSIHFTKAQRNAVIFKLSNIVSYIPWQWNFQRGAAAAVDRDGKTVFFSTM
jgi:hypothetical protein